VTAKIEFLFCGVNPRKNGNTAIKRYLKLHKTNQTERAIQKCKKHDVFLISCHKKIIDKKVR